MLMRDTAGSEYRQVVARSTRVRISGNSVGGSTLRKRYWGQHLWGRGYWVATSGNVTDEVWKKYIEDQKAETPDDHSMLCSTSALRADPIRL